MGEQIKFDVRELRRGLRNSGAILRIWLTKAVMWASAIYRFKSSFMNVLFVLLGYGFIVVACTSDDDPSEHSHHRQHQRGNYGVGPGAFGPDRSSTPIPGL